ncbi:uncharacterized protein EHS24_006982 [Apiotrichum porosum]|uniref:F-box domain-containing protein n=1 Tax=Apiotrichum porosum TaxID=105984 RepID=A0A427XWM8_9TREE|nr:uncharacterized protein EHS24_006982 [Apiotrichum porosum]RSH83306.1 hypothetical protein EHS24_006982 [Apiotrichum porosum]
MVSSLAPTAAKLHQLQTKVPTTQAPLVRLPSELQSLIFQYTPRSGLVTCLRVNSAFYHFALPLLFTHVHVPELHGRGPALTMVRDADAEGPFGSQTMKRPLMRKTWLKKVEFIDLDPHRKGKCPSVLRGYDNLKVLRMNFGKNTRFTDLHHPLRYGVNSVKPCANLLYMRPETMIVRGIHVRAHSNLKWVLPVSILERTKRQIFVITYPAGRPSIGWNHLVSHFGPVVEDITIIFFPIARPTVTVEAILEDVHNDNAKGLLDTCAPSKSYIHMMRLIVYQAFNKATLRRLTFVNANPFHLETPDEETWSVGVGVDDVLLKALVTEARRPGFGRKARTEKEVSDMIRTIGRWEYLDSEECKMVFDPNEVDSWFACAPSA